MIGLPTWFVVGILITFSDEFGKAMGMLNIPVPGKAVMFCYIGISLGDIGCGGISQLLKSRKKAMFIFLLHDIFCNGILFYDCSAINRSVLFYLCIARFRCRVLGDLCYDCKRAIRHEYPRNSDNDGSEFCTRCACAHHCSFSCLWNQGSALTESSAIIVELLTLVISRFSECWKKHS